MQLPIFVWASLICSGVGLPTVDIKKVSFEISCQKSYGSPGIYRQAENGEVRAQYTCEGFVLQDSADDGRAPELEVDLTFIEASRFSSPR